MTLLNRWEVVIIKEPLASIRTAGVIMLERMPRAGNMSFINFQLLKNGVTQKPACCPELVSILMN
jgi:hypothetical protein